MRWSQIRKQVREFICPELRAIVDFHVTGYRKAHDDVGEAWITVDGNKVFGAGFYKWWNAFGKLCASRDCLEPQSINNSGFATFSKLYRDTEQNLQNQGLYATDHLICALTDYLNMSLNDAIESKNHLTRAIAMLDRRLGKRRFSKVIIRESDLPIVKLFYQMRAVVISSDVV